MGTLKKVSNDDPHDGQQLEEFSRKSFHYRTLTLQEETAFDPNHQRSSRAITLRSVYKKLKRKRIGLWILK